MLFDSYWPCLNKRVLVMVVFPMAFVSMPVAVMVLVPISIVPIVIRSIILVSPDR
jgi:hypothetical protein